MGIKSGLYFRGGRWNNQAMTMPGKTNAEKRFVDFLQGKRLRLTSQRRAIIDSVFNTDKHFTAGQLLKWSRRRDRSVSRATIYRTLPLLTASGLVREMDFGGEHKFYDPNYADHPNHSHIICQDCDTIVEFDSDQIKKMESEMCRKLGFLIKAHRLQITCTCEQFRRLGKCNRQKPD
jgi:Fur family ferric uptake transcriptional regulator